MSLDVTSSVSPGVNCGSGRCAEFDGSRGAAVALFDGVVIELITPLTAVLITGGTVILIWCVATKYTTPATNPKSTKPPKELCVLLRDLFVMTVASLQKTRTCRPSPLIIT